MTLVTRVVTLTLFALAVLVMFGACGGSVTTTTTEVLPARSPVPGVEQTTTQTGLYRVELWTGPAITGMMMEFPTMSTENQGQPVNRHIEIHVFDRNTGAKVTSIVPSVNLTNQGTGVSQEMAATKEAGAAVGASFVTACLLSKHRAVEPHFGDNIYLPDGAYTVTIGLGSEIAKAEISF